jgi:hypothetical protein
MSDIRVGSLVVCVDDAINPWATENGYGYAKSPFLTKNWIYTVTGLGKTCSKHAGLFLRETQQDPPKWPFGSFRFRPVRNNEIDIFRKLAEPKWQKELCKYKKLSDERVSE